MNVYRQEYKSKKKGKSLEAMWGKIAEQLNRDRKEINSFLGEKSPKHCRDNINNLNKKYKKGKDESRRTGEGSDDIKGFPEFRELDEIWGTRDAVSPKFVVEAGTSSPDQKDGETNGPASESAISSPGSPNQSISEEATPPLQEVVGEVNEPGEESGSPLAASSSKKKSKKKPRRGEKRRKSTYEADEEEDSYAELVKAQRQLLKSREEERRELFAYLKESDSQNQNLILEIRYSQSPSY